MKSRTVLQWCLWLALLAVVTGLMFHFRGALDKAHVTLALLLLVLGASAAGGRALGLTVAALGFLAFDAFFLPPYQTLTITNPLDWLVLIAFLITSVVATQLLYRARSTAEEATQRAIEVDRLASLGAETLNAADPYEALRAITEVIRTSVNAEECDIYLHGEERGRLVDYIVEHGIGAAELSDGTVRIARDSVPPERRLRELIHEVEQMPDGRDRPAVHALGIPLQVRDRTVGVLRIATKNSFTLAPEQARLLVALAYYAALGAERARLVESAERVEAERRVERLRSALLTAVSHDLRTPLTTIKGIANEISRGGDPSRAEVIEAEADWLDSLVGDLLDLSRIQSGAVRPVLAVNTVDDLIGASLKRAAGALQNRRVNVDAPVGELLTGVFDLSQTVRILVNLIDNAAKYSPAEAPIDVRVRTRDKRITIDVMDRGPGIPESESVRIFESFYRPPGVPPDVRGHGLGLTIARGLAEAEGGTLRYASRAGGGSVFTLELPSSESL